MVTIKKLDIEYTPKKGRKFKHFTKKSTKQKEDSNAANWGQKKAMRHIENTQDNSKSKFLLISNYLIFLIFLSFCFF